MKFWFLLGRWCFLFLAASAVPLIIGWSLVGQPYKALEAATTFFGSMTFAMKFRKKYERHPDLPANHSDSAWPCNQAEVQGL